MIGVCLELRHSILPLLFTQRLKCYILSYRPEPRHNDTITIISNSLSGREIWIRFKCLCSVFLQNPTMTRRWCMSCFVLTQVLTRTNGDPLHLKVHLKEVISQWWRSRLSFRYYNDVIISAVASQITSLRIVYSTVIQAQMKENMTAPRSLAFVQGIHRWPVNSPHKRPVTRKRFPFDAVIMRSEPTISGEILN